MGIVGVDAGQYCKCGGCFGEGYCPEIYLLRFKGAEAQSLRACLVYLIDLALVE